MPVGEIAIVGGVASTMTDADALEVITCPVTPVTVADIETVALPLAAPAVKDTTTVAVCPAPSEIELCDAEQPEIAVVQPATSEYVEPSDPGLRTVNVSAAAACAGRMRAGVRATTDGVSSTVSS